MNEGWSADRSCRPARWSDAWPGPGQHPLAVVHDQSRVHGMEGPRVIDASIMPAVTSTNTSAPTIMIAGKGAVMIKAATRERLAA